MTVPNDIADPEQPHFHRPGPGDGRQTARNHQGGRPAARAAERPGKSKLDPYRPEIEALLANGSTQKFIAKRYGTTPANLSNRLRKNGIRKTRA